MIRLLLFVLLGIVIFIAFLSSLVVFLFVGTKRSWKRTMARFKIPYEAVTELIDEQTQRRKS